MTDKSLECYNILFQKRSTMLEYAAEQLKKTVLEAELRIYFGAGVVYGIGVVGAPAGQADLKVAVLHILHALLLGLHGQDMQDGTFELGLTRWGPDYADPMTYLGMWVTGNSNNYGLWSDADYDAVIDECTTGDLCTDPEGRWAALYEAEQIVLEQAVIFPLYGQCNAEMVSSAVTGVAFHPVALNRVYKNAAKSE